MTTGPPNFQSQVLRKSDRIIKLLRTGPASLSHRGVRGKDFKEGSRDSAEAGRSES
jgi:hypothetical protein